MSDKPTHPQYWFFHEYLDEARRMRVHKFTAETEADARRMHRSAADFRWATSHVEPSLSALFRLGDNRTVTIGPSCKPGQQYGSSDNPIPMPDYIRDRLRRFGMGDETALSGVRAADDRNPVLPPPSPPRTPAKQDGFDTPF
jgi:hypothetical protein